MAERGHGARRILCGGGIIGVGMVAHHLIMFAREATEGRRNASHYSAKLREVRFLPHGLTTRLQNGSEAKTGSRVGILAATGRARPT